MIRAPLLALLLAACASAPQDLQRAVPLQRASVDPVMATRAEGVRYLAMGEGQFVLHIYDNRISFARAGEDALDFPSVEPRYPRWSGEIYESEANGHRLRVAVRRADPCGGKDGRDTVEVTLDGAEFMGCGRAF